MKYIDSMRKNKITTLLCGLFLVGCLGCALYKIFGEWIIPAGLVGLATWLFIVVGYYTAIYKTLNICDINLSEYFNSNRLGIFILTLISVFFIVLDIKAFHVIYIWDSLEVWEPAVHCSNVVFQDPHALMNGLFHSINHADYNDFIPIFLSFPLWLFGTSFENYAIFLIFMFVIPAAFCFAIAAENFGKCLNRNFYFLLSMIIFLAVPSVIVPLIYGYANVSTLLPGSVIFLCLIKANIEKIEYNKMLAISGLSLLSVIQARTSAYLVVGMFFGYTLYILCKAYNEKQFKLYVFELVKKYLFIGIACVCTLLVCFHNFLIHNLTYDIKTAYSAYGLGMDSLGRLIASAEHFGAVLLIFVITGAVVCLRKKYISYFMFLVGWILFATFLFNRVQVMGIQHTYPILIPLLLLIALSFDYIKCKSVKLEIVMTIMFALNFAQVYFGIFPFHFVRDALPVVRYDINNLRALVKDLKDYANENGSRAYFIASSGLYNSFTLAKIDFPRVENAVPALFGTNDVDLRDGFPIQFLDSDIVLVATPVQIHLTDEGQRIIGELYNAMEEDTPISKHFKLVKEYECYPYLLDINRPKDSQKVVIKVYRKISPYTKSDIDYLENIFEKVYSKHPQLFKDRFEAYKEKLS